MKDWIIQIDKNMSDIPKWFRRTSAISSGIIMGTLIVGVCRSNGETTQVNPSGESGNNNNSSEQSASTENLTQEQIAQRTLDNFVATHPEYKSREAGVVNFIINGIDASTVVFETTEAEKTEISERKYVIEGDEVTPFTGAIVWTKETDFDGNERWVRLAGVQFQNEDDTTGAIYTVWYSSPYEDYTKVSTNVDFKRKVFAFNSNDDEYAYWPQVNPPTKIVWSDDMTQTDPSKFEFWNGNNPFMLPVNQVVEGGSKSLFAPAAIESSEPTLPAEPKKYSEAELNQMTPAEILAQAPELEGYEKWRAAGKYAMYLNAQGEVEKAYDMTIAEYRDIPEYPVTKPENFKNSEITDEELFNGDYFLWLQKEAKKLSCSPDMRTDIPMGIFRGAITPNPDTAPNFKNGGEFFIRDHTAAFTRFVLENGEEVHYAVMPVFMCDLNDPTNLYPIITVYSSYNLNTNRTQDSDNNLYMADVIPRWSNDMKVTPIVPNATMTYPGREGMNDPLVSRTFESLLINWKTRTQEFMNGNWSAFSEPKMVFLNDIGTNKAHKYE